MTQSSQDVWRRWCQTVFAKQRTYQRAWFKPNGGGNIQHVKAPVPQFSAVAIGPLAKDPYLLSSPGAGARGHIIGKRVPGCE